MNDIPNVKVYINGLVAGLRDKLYFCEKLELSEYDFIIDFGSGSGEVIKSLTNLVTNNNVKFIGVENNRELIKHTKESIKDNRVILVKNLEETTPLVSGRKNLLILSSILHEIDESDVEKLRNFTDYVDTIVIRDMLPPKQELRVFEMDTIYEVLKKEDPKKIKDFEANHGSIKFSKKNLYHYLLKYKYLDNWEKEVIENYFLSVDNLEKLNLDDKFNQIYKEEFRLLHQVKQISLDFGYTLNEPTHFKAIYTRRI